MHFTIVDYEARLIGDCSAHHREPQTRIGEWRFAVAGVAGGNPAYFAECEFLQKFETGTQMADVNRIESTAQ